MLDRMKTLGGALGTLARATGRLAWGVAAGSLGRCHFCGRKRIRVVFPEGLRYWGVDLVGGKEAREILFCPKCEKALLENARHIVQQSERKG